MVDGNAVDWDSMGVAVQSEAPVLPAAPVALDIDALPYAIEQGPISISNFVNQKYYDGEKFIGGFGRTFDYEPDYYMMRTRSKQLFTENLYCRGITRRYTTNIINTGLTLEANPEERILGYDDEGLADWSENVENLYNLWGSNKELCDFEGLKTLSQLQRDIFLNALVQGDVLIVLRFSAVTKLPLVQVIPGELVQDPTTPAKKGTKIKYGVEIVNGRHVAFHVRQEDGKTKRLKAYTSDGRKVAWLFYGTDKLHDTVRGEPLLSILLQSLKELDRYRDSAQRKAVVNSLVAMFIKRTSDAGGATLPTSAGATRVNKISTPDAGKAANTYTMAEYGAPGQVYQGLAEGEEPVMLGGNGTDVNFPIFEEAIISAMAWALETPPEIMRLAFSSNYSASQAAINEFKMFLDWRRASIGDDVCSPIYADWLLSNTLNGHVKAPGLLESWRDQSRFYEYSAWINNEWSGAVKHSTDILKQAKGYKLMVDEGFITRDRASRELTGTKFSKNIKKQKLEIVKLAEVTKIRVASETPVVTENLNLSAGTTSTADSKSGELEARVEEIEFKIEEQEGQE